MGGTTILASIGPLPPTCGLCSGERRGLRRVDQWHWLFRSMLELPRFVTVLLFDDSHAEETLAPECLPFLASWVFAFGLK